jgi:hypothetical protein
MAGGLPLLIGVGLVHERALPTIANSRSTVCLSHLNRIPQSKRSEPQRPTLQASLSTKKSRVQSTETMHGRFFLKHFAYSYRHPIGSYL